MTVLLSIDPGNTYSGWVLTEEGTNTPIAFGKDRNEDILSRITSDNSNEQIDYDDAVIEMIASYGMSAGASLFETCVWIGRFMEAIRLTSGIDASLVFRREVRLHHCLSTKANDSTVTQALIDRFGAGASNRGKGSKKEPGFFYGFAKDVWQAFALAVYWSDQKKGSKDNISSGAFRDS